MSVVPNIYLMMLYRMGQYTSSTCPTADVRGSNVHRSASPPSLYGICSALVISFASLVISLAVPAALGENIYL